MNDIATESDSNQNEAPVNSSEVPKIPNDNSEDRSLYDSSGFSTDEEACDQNVNIGPESSNKRIILQRFIIYNSKTTMYIVGSNSKESLFRIIEISASNTSSSLNVIEDKYYFYTRKDMIELINGLNESIEGGIHKIAQAYGLIGFIKFTKGYYLSVVTKCSQVAIIGGHFIYHIDETKLIPLDLNYKRPEKYSDEEKLLSIFKYLDLGKTFYFSYTYDITNSLQTNFIRHKKAALSSLKQDQEPTRKIFEHNERFVWNNLLLKPVLSQPDVATYEWFQPIIHGFIDQANISIYGRKIYITIIARRSHHFAGARFLKRGVNDRGNVANEVETEQIVSDMLITSFHDPKYGFFANPRFTSFVQHRGSIPLYWTQDLNRLPKPPIEINLSDPFYQSSAMHFNDLSSRYGDPIIILNLIKTKEKQPRESKLNQHFQDCLKYLNQFLPYDERLRYHSFDMSKHSKKNLDVIGPLQAIACSSIRETGFFHNGVDVKSTKIQRGIIRTNCIDCLDRTNAAQFIICKEALTHQLRSLGILSQSADLDYDSDLINILTEIFHDHGDTIAVQYGGSNLVNTMDSYRRINQWSSHTRDILNSIKRIYSNSFMDSIRQEAINLFLGNYIYEADKPKLWELQNDYYLHNNSQIQNFRIKPSYQKWYNTRKNLSSEITTGNDESNEYYSPYFHRLNPFPEYNDNWFNECYVPKNFQSFSDLFQFNMNSNLRYFPSNSNSTPKNFDYSPFETRKPYFKNRTSDTNRKPHLSDDNRDDIENLGANHGQEHGSYYDVATSNSRIAENNGQQRKFPAFLSKRNPPKVPHFPKVNTDQSQTQSENLKDTHQREAVHFNTNSHDSGIYKAHFQPSTIPASPSRPQTSENDTMHTTEDDRKIYEFSVKAGASSSQLLSQEPNFLKNDDLTTYWLYVDSGRNDSSGLSTEDDYFR